jgi:hypothetical protein
MNVLLENDFEEEGVKRKKNHLLYYRVVLCSSVCAIV